MNLYFADKPCLFARNFYRNISQISETYTSGGLDLLVLMQCSLKLANNFLQTDIVFLRIVSLQTSNFVVLQNCYFAKNFMTCNEQTDYISNEYLDMFQQQIFVWPSSLTIIYMKSFVGCFFKFETG